MSDHKNKWPRNQIDLLLIKGQIFIGGPKFKVSKNSDGGCSFELGYGGYQIELGYREKDNEVTFKITDAKNDLSYKGSIKHRPSA